MTYVTPNIKPDFSLASDGMSAAFRDKFGHNHALVTSQTNPLTGKVEISAGGEPVVSGVPRRLIGKVIGHQPVHRMSFSLTTLSDATNTCGNYKIGFTAVAPFSSPRFVFINRKTGDVPNDNNITVRFGVEVNGVIWPGYFNGKRDVVIEPGGFVISDPVPVSCTAADILYTRTVVSVAEAGMVWPLHGSVVARNAAAVPNEFAVLATTYADMSTSGSSSSGSVWSYCPSAMIAQSTNTESVVVLGDSIVAGAGSEWAAYGGRDAWSNLLLQTMGASVNRLGMNGEQAFHYAPASAFQSRKYISSFASHTICAHGINDVNNTSRTFAQIQADMLAIWTAEANAGRAVAQATLTPVTASTDGWTTLEGQTDSNARAPIIAQLNDWIRTMPAPLSAVIDVRRAVESSAGVNAWNPGYTADGLHPSPAGYSAMAEFPLVVAQTRAFLSL